MQYARATTEISARTDGQLGGGRVKLQDVYNHQLEAVQHAETGVENGLTHHIEVGKLILVEQIGISHHVVRVLD